MTISRENIIRMAREAGVYSGANEMVFAASLERFAALVAAHERKACAKICAEHWKCGGNAMECADAIRERGEK